VETLLYDQPPAIANKSVYTTNLGKLFDFRSVLGYKGGMLMFEILGELCEDALVIVIVRLDLNKRTGNVI